MGEGTEPWTFDTRQKKSQKNKTEPTTTPNDHTSRRRLAALSFLTCPGTCVARSPRWRRQHEVSGAQARQQQRQPPPRRVASACLSPLSARQGLGAPGLLPAIPVRHQKPVLVLTQTGVRTEGGPKTPVGPYPNGRKIAGPYPNGKKGPWSLPGRICPSKQTTKCPTWLTNILYIKSRWGLGLAKYGLKYGLWRLGLGRHKATIGYRAGYRR